MKLPRSLAALALAGGVLSTTGCDLTDLGIYRQPAAAPAPAPAPSVAAAAAMAPRAEVRPTPVMRSRATARFGTLVTDARGLVLYRSDRDSPRPSVSRCSGACTKTWRPVLVDGADLDVAGIDPALVGTVRRAGGGRQLTLAGWPVYTFAKDRPGQVLGQCKAGFFAITPEGAKTTMRG